MTTNDGADPGVLVLEEKAKAVQARLHPDARDQAIQTAVETNRAKFVGEFGVEPEPAFLAKTATKASGDYDDMTSADMDALKVVTETLVASYAADVAKAEELPTALADAEREKGNGLTFEQRYQVEQTHELKTGNLRADLQGADFDRVLAAYQRAVAADDRTALRYLERQRGLRWPGIVRDGAAVDQELALEQLIKATRAARVPATLRAAHRRAGKAWTLTLDTAHRTFRRGGLHVVAK